MYTRIISLLTVALLLMWGVACDKKCQPPLTERPTTITQYPWRLVSTTNPEVRNLDKYNFTVLTFTMNNQGNIKAVQNNTQFDNPLYNFEYKLATDDGRSGQIRIVYTAAQSQDQTQSTDPNNPPPTPAPSSPVDYRYDLGTELNLTEVGTGYQYVYVPFQGIVAPDNTCTF